METTLTKRGQTVVPAEIRKRYNLKEGATIAWIDDGTGIRIVFLPSEPVKALRGSAKGRKLTEKLLAERRADYKYEKVRS